MLADASAKLRDLYVFGVHGVSVERRAVCEDCDQSCIVGARQMQRVKADREALDLRDNPAQLAQQIYMFFTGELLDVSSILPNHNMCQHFLATKKHKRHKTDAHESTFAANSFEILN